MTKAMMLTETLVLLKVTHMVGGLVFKVFLALCCFQIICQWS